MSITERIRVVQVVTSLAEGGLARYALDLMRSVDKDQCEMHLVCTHFEGEHFGEAQGVAASVTVLGARKQLSKLAGLTRLIRSLRPNAVHVHQEPVGLIAARFAGVPVRLETVHLAKYWLNDCHPITQAAACVCATWHIVNNDVEKSIIAKRANPRKIRVIHPGLDPSRWKPYWTRSNAPLPPQCTLPEGAFVIGTIARLTLQKGVKYLLEAAPEILKNIPAAVFLIVGDGDLRGELEQQCVNLKIADRVLFTGYQADGYRFLGAMDVFVMSSLFESWGFTAMEAMWAGVPVVATDIPGPKEFITHGETGLMVDPANSGAIASSVVRIAADSSIRNRLAVAAQQYVRTQHSIAGMVHQYNRLYRALPL